MRALLNALTADPVLCVLVAAALTWAAHSSVAIVLLIMSLAFSQFITPAAALALVLGANLGSAINPVFESGRREDRSSYQLPVGNLINRLVGVVVVLPFLPWIASTFQAIEPNASRMTAEFHIAFNVVLALVFIGLLDPMAALLRRMFPAQAVSTDAAAPRYLDESALATPSLALGRCGARDAAHGRHGRDDAAPGDDGADDQRPRAGRAGLAHATTSSTSSTRRSSST